MSPSHLISQTPTTERLLEKQFSQSQEGTPSATNLALATRSRTEQIHQLRGIRAFSSYESTIIRFYEDIIASLQKRLFEYEQLLTGQNGETIETEPEYELETTVKPASSML